MYFMSTQSAWYVIAAAAVNLATLVTLCFSQLESEAKISRLMVISLPVIQLPE